jgi:hypothetical protein
MTRTAPATLTLPAAPRPLNRHVVRRSWGEGKVRFWWMSALVVLAVASYVGSQRVAEELKHRRLINNGVLTKATAFEVSGVSEHQNRNFAVMRDQKIPVKFNAVMPDGKIVEFGGYLEPSDGYIRVNDKMDLLVDPKDPNTWSEDVKPQSWLHVLSIPLFMMLPVAALALGMAELRRRQVLAVWRDGIRTSGVVVAVKHTAAAPLSRVVHYTLADGRDRRVFKVLYPGNAGVPSRGDPLTLIVPDQGPQDSLVAELYARPGDQQPSTD